MDAACKGCVMMCHKSDTALLFAPGHANSPELSAGFISYMFSCQGRYDCRLMQLLCVSVRKSGSHHRANMLVYCRPLPAAGIYKAG